MSTIETSENRAHRITPIMSNYPLSLGLVAGLKELVLCDWEQSGGDIILELKLTDEQVATIQAALKQAEMYNLTHDTEGRLILPILTEQYQQCAVVQ